MLIKTNSVKSIILLLLFSSASFLFFCSKNSTDSSTENTQVTITVPDVSKNYTLTWDNNRESAVNSSGGGYRIYYSPNSGFDISDSNVTVIDVPYVSGAYAPSSAVVQLTKGTWYFVIKAYSALQ